MIPLETVELKAKQKVSPDFVRISAASAIALRLQSGRFSREFEFGGINILLNYENGCFSDCGYCGLARTRPGSYEEKSFIRVDWPLVDMDVLADRMARYEGKMTRLCISMVTHGSAYRDTVEITKRIVSRVSIPLSILIAPPTLNRERLQVFKDLGVDMIGVGLDAVSEEVFRQHRTDVPNGSLKWDNYWDIINHSRRIFGPGRVNVHTVVGLGETDQDMVKMFYRLKEQEILPYLFSFNPEPDSRMGDWPRASIKRWRRIQLIKHLIEHHDLSSLAIDFDETGSIEKLNVEDQSISEAVKTLDQGIPFMTNGCPGESGEVGCTRPYGSYKPSETFRDFPFKPAENDLDTIIEEIELEEILN